jgi:hypothetical protein
VTSRLVIPDGYAGLDALRRFVAAMTRLLEEPGGRARVTLG